MTRIQQLLQQCDVQLRQAKLRNQERCQTHSNEEHYMFALTHSAISLLMEAVSELEVELHQHTLQS